MSQTKRTYALPANVIGDFEKTVPAGERSAVVADLIRVWLDERQRRSLRKRVIEGCRDMTGVSLELEKDFHPLEEEVHRGLDGPPKTRRRRASSARSGRRVGTGR